MFKENFKFKPDITIEIGGKFQELTFLDMTQTIRKSIAFIKTADGEYRINCVDYFKFEGAYDKETDSVYVRANLLKNVYEVSREQPYDKDYMMVFYVTSTTFNVIIIFSSPVNGDGSLSGVYFDVGFWGISWHMVEELMSSYISAINDEKLRIEMEKVFKNITHDKFQPMISQVPKHSDELINMFNGGDNHVA